MQDMKKKTMKLFLSVVCLEPGGFLFAGEMAHGMKTQVVCIFSEREMPGNLITCLSATMCTLRRCQYYYYLISFIHNNNTALPQNRFCVTVYTKYGIRGSHNIHK